MQRLGGPAGAAARVRALVPDGASVAAQVREILARVRDEGDGAVLDYTRRFDTAGAQPRPLLVDRRASSTRRSSGCRSS